MTNKNAEGARYTFILSTLALVFLGVIAIVAVVGVLLGNDKGWPVLTAVIPLLAHPLGLRHLANKKRTL